MAQFRNIRHRYFHSFAPLRTNSHSFAIMSHYFALSHISSHYLFCTVPQCYKYSALFQSTSQCIAFYFVSIRIVSQRLALFRKVSHCFALRRVVSHRCIRFSQHIALLRLLALHFWLPPIITRFSYLFLLWLCQWMYQHFLAFRSMSLYFAFLRRVSSFPVFLMFSQ